MSDLYDTLDKSLYKITPTTNPGVYEISPEQIGSGSLLSTVVQNIGNFQNGKTTFTNTDSGFILGVDEGVAKFYIGNSTSYLNWTGTALNISGTLTAVTIDIGGSDATSFHVDASGNMWLGAAAFADGPFKVSSAGAVTATGVTISGALTTAAGSSINGTYIDSLNVSKLATGTISSKQITLAITAGTGDTYINSGKTDFTNTQSGFILGMDDSDSDLAKFYIGDSTNYINWTGSDLVLNGYGLTTVVEGATADINFGLFRGAYNDGLTSVVNNSTTTRSLLTTDAQFSTGSTGWQLYSGVFGSIADSTKLTWQNDYSFFVRLKSDTGTAWSNATEGRGYFWGLVETGMGTLAQPFNQMAYGRIFDESMIGFYVGGDDNLYAISSTGLITTGATGLASMDVTDLSGYDHSTFHNYKIITHYAALAANSNSGFLRPTAHVGGNSNQANMYDSDTTTAGFAERTGQLDLVALSWNGGTTYTAGIPNTIELVKTVVTIGGQYETFGRTWSPSEFSNANFKVKLCDVTALAPWGNAVTDSITFSTFGFDTSTWVEITGIEIELTSETEDEGDGGVAEHKIYDIRVKVYYTTAANTGYAKFYIDDVLVATHKTSIPRGTEETIVLFAGGPNGANVASGRHIWYNNYRLKVL